jgi:hypothetical protein
MLARPRPTGLSSLRPRSRQDAERHRIPFTVTVSLACRDPPPSPRSVVGRPQRSLLFAARFDDARQRHRIPLTRPASLATARSSASQGSSCFRSPGLSRVRSRQGRRPSRRQGPPALGSCQGKRLRDCFERYRFRERSYVEGFPPTIIWLDVGNAGSVAIAALLRREHQRIELFEKQDEASLLSCRSAQARSRPPDAAPQSASATWSRGSNWPSLGTIRPAVDAPARWYGYNLNRSDFSRPLPSQTSKR